MGKETFDVFDQIKDPNGIAIDLGVLDWNNSYMAI